MKTLNAESVDAGAEPNAQNGPEKWFSGIFSLKGARYWRNWVGRANLFSYAIYIHTITSPHYNVRFVFKVNPK